MVNQVLTLDERIEKALSDAALPETAKAWKARAQHLEATGAAIAALGKEIAATHAQSPASRLLASIPGVGKIAASAPEPGIFKPGRDFSAWLDAPAKFQRRQGKARLHHQTGQPHHQAAARARRSNRGKRLRRRDIVGSRGAGKRKGSPRDWLAALLARKPARLAAAALANKLARIIWAVMTRSEAFRTGTFAPGLSHRDFRTGTCAPGLAHRDLRTRMRERRR